MQNRNTAPDARTVTLRFVRSYEELRYLGKVKTKSEFAAKVGIATASNIIRMEKNENNAPSLNSICLLFSEYNVNPDWLFFGKKPFLRE